MSRVFSRSELTATLSGKVRHPTILMWNRLEGRPRATDFTRALKAEARDALWLLTRQWQMGEFAGEDAASPATAKVAWRTEAVDGLRARDGDWVPLKTDRPLEAQVEALPVRLTLADRLHNANLRLAMGRQWQKTLVAAGLQARVADFLRGYTFEAPDPGVVGDTLITASAGTWQLLAALAGRAIDGGAVLLHLLDPGSKASDGLGLTPDAAALLDPLGDAFLAWSRARYTTPDQDLDAWVARHLTYDFALIAPDRAGSTELAALDYHGGRLDWYHFDAQKPDAAHAPAGSVPDLQVTSFLPTQAQFDGMPHTRHWAFEEAAVNFGDIAPDTTDLAKLLLIEFGLVYANDWFLLPLDLPIGTLTRIEGLSVTNVFGERTWIAPAVTTDAPETGWQMFHLTDKGHADDRLFLPTTAPIGLESQPIEAVDFVRDEVSNMVWGVERVVQTADGQARRGRTVGQEVRAKFQAAVAAPVPGTPATNTANVQYTLMKTVPENWIPFVPVHVAGDNREIQLQRGSMPRLLDDAADAMPEKVRPRTALLRRGLDADPPAPLYLAEEDIARAGTVVETRWQRCRWQNGEVVLWLGHKRSVGRGEIHSGLAFDRLDPKRG